MWHTAIAPMLRARGDMLFAEHESSAVPSLVFTRNGRLCYCQAGNVSETVYASQ